MPNPGVTSIEFGDFQPCLIATATNSEYFSWRKMHKARLQGSSSASRHNRFAPDWLQVHQVIIGYRRYRLSNKPYYQWIGSREKLQEIMVVTMKNLGFS